MVRTMFILDSRWKPIIIYNLGASTLRFGKLIEKIPLISRKALAEQLKGLEASGIVRRNAFKELPPKVEYSLTEKGLALLPALNLIIEWTISISIA